MKGKPTSFLPGGLIASGVVLALPEVVYQVDDQVGNTALSSKVIVHAIQLVAIESQSNFHASSLTFPSHR
jgi:hypothetical protein